MHIGLAAALLAAQAGSGLARFQYPDCVGGPLANTTACDVKASPSARAAAVVRALNITEKLANLVECVALFTPTFISSPLFDSLTPAYPPCYTKQQTSH